MFGHKMFGRFVHKRFALLKICRTYEQTSCLQLLLETTVGHFNCLYKRNMKKQAIKFLWQKQEVTPVKTVLETPGFLCILLSDERI